jgi:hypothetical protein
MTSDKLAEARLEKVRQMLQSELEKQVKWHRQHGAIASRDQFITIAAKLVSQKLEHRANKTGADGKIGIANLLEAMREELLPDIVQELRSKR